MDDVVAVAVELDDGSSRYFVTWGRIQDTVDPTPLEHLVLEQSSHVSLGGTARRARVCWTMQEAALSGSAPYFFEAFLWFTSRPIPFGPGYEQWRAERDLAMRLGREIHYCGKAIPAPEF